MGSAHEHGVRPMTKVALAITEAPTLRATTTSSSLTVTIGEVAGATGYEINWSGSDEWLLITERVFTHSSLAPGSQYTLRARARNSAGTGLPSGYMSWWTSTTPPTGQAYEDTTFRSVRRVFAGWRRKDSFDAATLGDYDSDKVAGYYEIYRRFLEPLRWKRIYLMEIGIHRGGSLAFWRDYLPLAKIAGVDVQIPEETARQFPGEDGVRCFEGNQTDCRFLSRVAEETAKNGFDVVIDDACHFGVESKVSFWHLFDHHLKPGGLYFIEDWGTGYWDDWSDGKSMDLEEHTRTPSSLASHTHGMVGFIKQLIDEQGAKDATRKHLHGAPERKSKFRSTSIFPGMVVIEKA